MKFGARVCHIPRRRWGTFVATSVRHVRDMVLSALSEGVPGQGHMAHVPGPWVTRPARGGHCHGTPVLVAKADLCRGARASPRMHTPTAAAPRAAMLFGAALPGGAGETDG